MLRFYAHRYAAISTILAKAEMVVAAEPPATPVFSTPDLSDFNELPRLKKDIIAKWKKTLRETEKARLDLHETMAAGKDGIWEQVLQALPMMRRECLAIGLTSTVAQIDRILSAASLNVQENIRNRILPQFVSDLCLRFEDELRSRLFLAVDLSDQACYEDPLKGWGDVPSKFPSTVRCNDLEEAGKCLATNRDTACVFHLMRVMEVGLRVLAATLNDFRLDPKRNPSWDAILKKCREELAKPLAQRSPEWAADDRFFSGAAATLMAVKDAWRNPTMHVETHYDKEKATDVWNAVQAFMRHLATKLSE